MSRQRSIETIMNSEYVSIGELVRLTNTRYSTLKYYTEISILPFEQEDIQLTRRYKRVETIERLKEIKRFKKQGLTIDEIKKKYNVVDNICNF